MNLSDFQFELPPELIAQQPLSQRDASRMLILDREKSSWEDSAFRALPDLLRGDEVIVVNNTRVIPARLLRAMRCRRTERRTGTGRFRPRRKIRNRTATLRHGGASTLRTKSAEPEESETTA